MAGKINLKLDEALESGSAQPVVENGGRKKRSPNKNAWLNNVRANLSDEVFKLLTDKETSSGQSRDMIIESALRVFMSADTTTRREALLATKATRVKEDSDNI